MGSGSYLVGVAFWVFVGACAIGGMVAEYKKRRLVIDLLRTTIDKGQPLDVALVERIMAQDQRDQRTEPQDLKLGGIITTFSGIGVMAFAFFVAKVAEIAFYPVLGAGFVAVCVGVGLMVGARSLAEARSREHNSPPT